MWMEEAAPGSESIVIYPNPANSGFSISNAKASGSMDVRIMDGTGRLVLQSSAGPDEFMDLPYLDQ